LSLPCRAVRLQNIDFVFSNCGIVCAFQGLIGAELLTYHQSSFEQYSQPIGSITLSNLWKMIPSSARRGLRSSGRSAGWLYKRTSETRR
jgi:hypothetical protein